MPDFGRYSIVGFDLRQSPILDLGGPKRLGEHNPTDVPCGPPYQCTISSGPWPRSGAIGALGYPRTNGLDLLWLPDTQAADTGAVSVAFSMKSADAGEIRETSHILDLDEAMLGEAARWTLLGYDVADDMLGYSGFYGFTWKPGELSEVLKGIDFTFNRRGLIDHEATAERIAKRFSERVETSSHAPFWPVRVLVQAKAT